jgi:hypothetical protein
MRERPTLQFKVFVVIVLISALTFALLALAHQALS